MLPNGKLYYTQSELEAQGHDVNAIVLDVLSRRDEGNTGHEMYDKYKDAIYLGGNELEGREEAYIFMTQEDFDEWQGLQ